MIPTTATPPVLYRRADSEERGRHLVAACALERGRLVLAERPLLAMPSLDNVRYHATCHCCLAFVGGPHATLQRRINTINEESSSSSTTDSIYTVVPCRSGCGHVYCSEACERDAWTAHHFCLCTGTCESEDDALVRFKRFCVETNEILLLVAEWWVAQHTMLQNDPNRHASYTDFQMNLWWDVLTADATKQPGGLVEDAKLQETLETICADAAALLNQVFEEQSSSSYPIVPTITVLDIAQRVGACEQNAMGIRQRSPLCRDVFDMLSADTTSPLECQALVQCLDEAGFIGGEEEEEEAFSNDDKESSVKGPTEPSLSSTQDFDASVLGDDENGSLMEARYTPDEIAQFISSLRIDEDGSVRDLAVPTSGTDDLGVGDDLDLVFPPLDGTAMYSTICKMNHSCDPNIMVVYRRLPGWGRHFPLTAFCVAIRDIDLGEELTISYIDVNEPYDERTKALSSYGFTCQCIPCTTEMDNNGEDCTGTEQAEVVKTSVNPDDIFGSESDDECDACPEKDDGSEDGLAKLQGILCRLDTTANHSRFGTIPHKIFCSVSVFVMRTAKEITSDVHAVGDKRSGLLDQCVAALQQRDYCLAKIVAGDLESLVASCLTARGGFANASERALYWCAALTAAIGLSYDYNFLESQVLCDKAFTLGLASSTDGYSHFFRYIEQFSTQMSRGPYQCISLPDCWNGTEGNREAVENQMQTDSPIPEISMSANDFDVLFGNSEPAVFRNMASNWPAVKKWQNLRYLCELGGQRLVPIELDSMIGGSMKETFMTFRQFIEEYVVPSNQHGRWSLNDCNRPSLQVAYLAQHPLIEQIPALRNDVMTFDFIFKSPPQETMMWVGTGGTRTPLHFDSYDNLFVQVVGLKYVRLYGPDQTPKLYVSSSAKDDDVSLAKQGNMSALNCEQEDFARHTMAATAVFTDVILAPGDCLFIPAQTWHYVRSLTTSMSVNFWM